MTATTTAAISTPIIAMVAATVPALMYYYTITIVCGRGNDGSPRPAHGAGS